MRFNLEVMDHEDNKLHGLTISKGVSYLRNRVEIERENHDK